MSNDSCRIDKRLMRIAFDRAAPHYEELAVLQKEVGERLLERLDLIRFRPDSILDIGSGSGQISRALAKRYRHAQVTAVDLSESMLAISRSRAKWWRRHGLVCGDMESLPFGDATADMVISNLTLQWCNDLDRVFSELGRVLKPDGVVFFTTFGPDTLKELRSSWAAADRFNHVNAFPDMHDIGDAMLRAGLADAVVDREDLTLLYRNIRQLMRDLKGIGAHNVTSGRPRGLTTPRELERVEAAYETYRREDGLPATWEVIYGHAWLTRRDSVEIPVNAIR